MWYKPRQIQKAFTLVELLVCIGIIAILMALLLPTLAAVSRSRKSVICQNTLRNLQTAISNHVADHSGYGPLAGDVVIRNQGADDIAVLLGDATRSRYDYIPTQGPALPWTTTVAPLQIALAPYLGLRAARDEWLSQLPPLPAVSGWGAFRCPAVDDSTRAGSSTYALVYQNIISQASTNLPMDYAPNEHLYGFGSYDNAGGLTRLGGNLSRLAKPSQTLSIIDGGTALARARLPVSCSLIRLRRPQR